MTFVELVNKAIGFINIGVVLIIGLSLVAFLWGGVQYITHANEPQGREKWGKKLTWGIIGLFVAVSVWGLVNFMKLTFGV